MGRNTLAVVYGIITIVINTKAEVAIYTKLGRKENDVKVEGEQKIKEIEESL